MPLVTLRIAFACACAVLLVHLPVRAEPAAAAGGRTIPATSTAPATNPASLEADVEALIKQLGNDDWPTRMAAQNRLASLGELAEPRLKIAARDSDDAEVRARAEAALHAIADNRLVGPTRITMKVFNVHPQIAFNEIARQAGFEFKSPSPLMNNPQLPPVTLDVQREPMWEVVRRVREQCGFDLEPGPMGPVIVQIPPGPDKAPTVTSGAFRVRATRISRSYAVDLTSGGLVVNDFAVHLALQPEPKLKIQTGAVAAKVEAAADENGLSLLPPEGAPAVAGAGAGPGAIQVMPGMPANAAAAAMQNAMVLRGNVAVGMRPDAAAWPVTARLEYPAQNAGKRIARLKGSTSCTVVVRTDTLEIPDVLNATNVTREAGATSITVRSCRKVGEQYELMLNVGAEGGAMAVQQLVARVGRSASGGVRLIDSTGRDLPQQGMRRMTAASNGRTDITLTFGDARVPQAAAAGPMKLMWEVPAELRDFEVPFEFIDLPLP